MAFTTLNWRPPSGQRLAPVGSLWVLGPLVKGGRPFLRVKTMGLRPIILTLSQSPNLSKTIKHPNPNFKIYLDKIGTACPWKR